MATFEENLEKYAELAVKVGVNVQPGQPLYIGASIESAEFVRLVVKKAYEAGASHVIVDWGDDEVTRLRYELAPEASFSEFPDWIPAMRQELIDMNAAFMNIVSQSPDLLKNADPNKIATFQKTAGQALEGYRQAVQSDKVSWTVIAAPSAAWAAKVFPDKPEADQVPALWDAIFKAVRADTEDPVAAWKKHDETLHEKVEHLNERKYAKLHYTAPGTDLTIGLPEGHLWAGAGSINAKGNEFMANMPTEEVFTVPHKDRIDGYVSSTKPLSYSGNIIDNFKITFESGRISAVEAEQGEDVLKHLIEADEGAKSLGEVALVPHSSPISTSGILFFNTLFDENASNHLAIGSAYAFCVEGGKEMDRAELEAHGLNQSITHVDFMIGSDRMDIDGILDDGTREPIFRGGEWAF